PADPVRIRPRRPAGRHIRRGARDEAPADAALAWAALAPLARRPALLRRRPAASAGHRSDPPADGRDAERRLRADDRGPAGGVTALVPPRLESARGRAPTPSGSASAVARVAPCQSCDSRYR